MSDSSPERDVTPESEYRGRREFLKGAGLFAAGATAVGGGLWALMARRSSGGAAPPTPAAPPEPLPVGPAGQATAGLYDTDEPQTSYADATTYNNYYELGTGKADPARNAHHLVTKPWTVEVAGLVKKPGRIDFETLLGWFPLEERIYRMRCVEAWSMVIPWLGFPLRALLDRVEPTDRAKYVAFQTLHDPERLPGQRRPVLAWPYVEGLRLDEAMHPLTFLSVGMYGKTLPGQNGAPIRLVVPWKYGFKGIKSIVRIELTETRPPTSWNLAASREYGFYANVNPEVDHPRWSQATERRIGDFARRPTLPFNGYAQHVAHLYAGLDLRTNF